ncbi:protein of unknown function DUF115 [Desulfovibrio sp. X2]|uniref:6-hydroxymethylpterin diphosphokinase MptE-like protein n=1 Tax=Desulfovibrio sp. X2 TaxID=941449 RepID=UPI000358B570|nr:6-hydroxymethylpterin diphosphokinase MptE-like protein [Desulfovibrio sp. X2]EPR40227.1 protein of unknown function DUF115 [Desulfovibrio sp. X2]
MHMLERLAQAGGLLDCGGDGPHLPCSGKGHAPSSHDSLFRYVPPALRRPFADPDRPPVFSVYDGRTDLAELRRDTRLFLVLGACPSPELDALLHDPDAACVVVDPDRARLTALAEESGAAEGRAPKTIWVTGDVAAARFGLGGLFLSGIFDHGFPAVLAPRGEEEAWLEALGEVVEYVEVLYYRSAIHVLDGHDLTRCRPLRDVALSPYHLDQLAHCFENLPDYARCPDVEALRDSFAGGTAVLVGAGPDLDERLDLLRRLKGRALIICVNNALRTLVRRGIEPDICLVMDPALMIAKSYTDVPHLPDTLLVAHRFCHVPRRVFDRVVFFGNPIEQAAGPGTELPRHGSVISAAFSLAELLGAARCIIVGGQLASPDPWRLGYSAASIHGGSASSLAARPLIGTHPQLYPVRLPHGRTLYTTPNFRDASLWLLARMADSRMEVVNTSPDSLLFGPDITLDQDPALPPPAPGMHVPHPSHVAASLPEHLPVRRVRELLAFGVERAAFWREVRAAAQTVLAAHTPLPQATAVFAHFEANTVSYLVSRFEDFDNQAFHTAWFAGHDREARRAALADYFRHVEGMANMLLSRLAVSLNRLRQLGG